MPDRAPGRKLLRRAGQVPGQLQGRVRALRGPGGRHDDPPRLVAHSIFIAGEASSLADPGTDHEAGAGKATCFVDRPPDSPPGTGDTHADDPQKSSNARAESPGRPEDSVGDGSGSVTDGLGDADGPDAQGPDGESLDGESLDTAGGPDTASPGATAAGKRPLVRSRAIAQGMRRRIGRRRRKRSAGTTRPQTRRERRQAAKVRRARATVVGAALLSGLILVLWFPAGSLLHQRAAINAAASQLSHLQQQDGQLAKEQKALGSPAEIERVARQQYQLVNPGERAFLVLPPAGTKTSATQYQGDPANQPLVTPSAATELPPGGSTASTGSSGGASSGGGSTSTQGSAGARGSHASRGTPGFLGRVAQTLEFWR